MAKEKEYRDKLAEETASFLDSIPGIFDAMKDMLPEGEMKELWSKAADETKEGLKKSAKEIREGNDELKDRLAEVKPPALWELEKMMYNESAAELGIEPIKDADGQEQEDGEIRIWEEDEGTS